LHKFEFFRKIITKKEIEVKLMANKQKIKGKINGEPEIYSYVRSCELIFSLELMTDLPEIQKKIGDTVVVHYSSSYITYVRLNDVIEFTGKIDTRYMKNLNKSINYIEAHRLFNETLQFSYDY